MARPVGAPYAAVRAACDFEPGQSSPPEAIWQERQEAIQRGEYERDTKLANEQHRLGTFRSQFLHNPDDGALPIYGTVPTDVGKLITIGTAIDADLVKPPA
jgi:hypothetical protein